MARLLTAGGEGGHYHVDNAILVSGAVSTQTSIKRSGAYAYAFASGAGNATSSLRLVNTIGAVIDTASAFGRLWLHVDDLPTSAAIMASLNPINSATALLQFKLNTNGTINACDSAGTTIAGTTASAAIAADTWFSITFTLVYSDAGNETLTWQVDGTTVDSGVSAALGATGPGEFRLGWLSAPGANRTLYVDDVALNGSNGAAPTTAPSRLGKIVALLPVDITTMGEWTGGAGGTTEANLLTAISTRPPAGTATETNTSQIESAAVSQVNELIVDTSTYTAAGIGGSDTINLLYAICVDGEDVGTGDKTAHLHVSANPDDGTPAGFFVGPGSGVSSALGTYPTNWFVHTSSITTSPSPTLGTGASINLTDNDTSSRVQSYCFLAVMVEYTPNVATPSFNYRPLKSLTRLRR